MASVVPREAKMNWIDEPAVVKTRMQQNFKQVMLSVFSVLWLIPNLNKQGLNSNVLISRKNFDTFFYPFPQAWMKLYPQRLLIFLALKRYIFLLIGMDDTFPNKNPHIPEFGKVQRRVWSALYTPTIITRVYFTNNVIYLCLLLDLHEQLPCISFSLNSVSH